MIEHCDIGSEDADDIDQPEDRSLAYITRPKPNRLMQCNAYLSNISSNYKALRCILHQSNLSFH